MRPLTVHEKNWMREGIAALNNDFFGRPEGQTREQKIADLACNLLDLLVDRGILDYWDRRPKTVENCLSVQELEDIKELCYEEGHDDGHKQGYKEGYDQGVSDGEDKGEW